MFGQLLRATRRAHNMGLAKLAEKVGIGPKHLGRVERGETNVTVWNLVRIATALGIDPCELVRGLRG